MNALLERAALSPGHSDTLARLREMVCALENGDEALFELRMNKLVGMREGVLLGNVVKITRDLHKAVKEINCDDQLTMIANSGIPDACQRLDYVVQVTEEAAHKTLDLVDRSKVLTEQITQAAGRLSHVRTGADAASYSRSYVRKLLEMVGSIETTVQDSAFELRGNLTALAQTQEYQDLTGQIIKRVIRLVRDVESALIALLRSTGSASNAGHGLGAYQNNEKLEGPTVPGLSISTSQQDADALLAELGF